MVEGTLAEFPINPAGLLSMLMRVGVGASLAGVVAAFG
jgi:hypothetical protein